MEAIVLAVTFVTLAWLPAIAREWLPDGGFEAGRAGWIIEDALEATCPPHSGDNALGIDAEDGIPAIASRLLGPMPAGTYTVSGWSMLQSGAGQIDVTLLFPEASGPAEPRRIASAGEYQQFSVQFGFLAATDSAQLLFEFQPDGFAVLCLDDLSVSSEDLPTATPTQAATATVPAGDSTATPPSGTTPNATVTPTQTAIPTMSPTPSASSTPTPTPGPSFVFTNGGFEDGLSGWNKYGGTLTTTGSALSGGTSGLLISDTESTKWAFQAVHIDSTSYYEFAAGVLPDAGVREAYLRISWYASPDATGSALSTSDSLQRARPGVYTLLTTGAVQPPPGAASARVRIVLAPTSAAAASLTIDDASFATTAAPTPTPMPSATSTPTPAPTATTSTPPTVLLPTPDTSTTEGASTASAAETAEPADAVDSQALAAPASEDASTPEVTAHTSPQHVAEVASARSEAATVPVTSQSPAAVSTRQPGDDGSFSWPWVLGVVLLLGGLAGVYVQNRRAAQ